MEICIKQIDMLENNMNDFIRLEDSWDMVKTSVGCTILALKGVFNLMSVEECNEIRRPSSVFAGGNLLRRLSSAFAGSSSTSSRQSSVSAPLASARRDSSTVEYHTPNYLRASVSKRCADFASFVVVIPTAVELLPAHAAVYHPAHPGGNGRRNQPL